MVVEGENKLIHLYRNFNVLQAYLDHVCPDLEARDAVHAIVCGDSDLVHGLTLAMLAPGWPLPKMVLWRTSETVVMSDYIRCINGYNYKQPAATERNASAPQRADASAQRGRQQQGKRVTPAELLALFLIAMGNVRERWRKGVIWGVAKWVG